MSMKEIFESVGVNSQEASELVTVFEAKVEEKVQVRLTEATSELNEQIATLREENSQLSESVNEENISQLAEKLDVFLEQTVADWANANSVELQEASVVAGASRLLQNIAEGAQAFNTAIPEGDSLERLAEANQTINTLRAKLNDSNTRLYESVRENEAMARRQIVESLVDDDMSIYAQEKFRNLCESAPFESADKFRALAEGMKYMTAKEGKGKGGYDQYKEGQYKMKEAMKMKDESEMMLKQGGIKEGKMKKERAMKMMEEADKMMEEGKKMMMNGMDKEKMMEEAEKMMDEGKKMMDEGKYMMGGKMMEDGKRVKEAVMMKTTDSGKPHLQSDQATGDIEGGTGKQSRTGKVQESMAHTGVDMDLF